MSVWCPLAGDLRTTIAAWADGARVKQVDEHLGQDQAVFVFEVESYPEAKILSPEELRGLYSRFRRHVDVGSLIGASEAFVRQAVKIRKPSS